MARDFLAISLSTVPSESAFSLGGRILGESRSSLTPEMLEALVCGKDWLFKGPSLSSVGTLPGAGAADPGFELRSFQDFPPGDSSSHLSLQTWSS